MKTNTLKDVVAAFRAEFNAAAAKRKAEAQAREAQEAANHAALMNETNLFADELVPLINGKTWRIDQGNSAYSAFEILRGGPKPEVFLTITSQYLEPTRIRYRVHEAYSVPIYTHDRGEALVLAAKTIGRQLAREDQAK